MGTVEIALELRRAFVGYGRWVAAEARHVSPHNYVYLLVGLTVAVMIAERLRPARASIPARGDVGRGLAYAFLNFFGFGLLGYAAISDVTAAHTARALDALGVPRLSLVGMHPVATAALYLVLRDFGEYWIHRLLHRVPLLWRLHALHHSAKEMHVLVHLRYHPLETLVYRTLEFLPLTLLGFDGGDFFFAHAFALLVGHLNHANLRIPLGPLRYVLNSAELHLVHHAKHLPEGVPTGAHGVNFGLTFSLWDFLFGTASVPAASLFARDRPELGFDGIEAFPRGMGRELLSPFAVRPARLTGSDAQDDAS